MFNKTELFLLSNLSRGIDEIMALSKAINKSLSQTYKVVSSLNEKGVISLKDGIVIPEMKTHISLLLTILRESHDSYIPLSGNTLDMIPFLRKPCTAKELALSVGISERSVRNNISEMRTLSMLRKNGSKYSINMKIWPQLKDLADAIDQYRRSTDERVPPGSILFYADRELVLFSNDKVLDNYTATSFSRYSDMGIKIYLGTKYYCNMPALLTVREVFIHSLHIIAADKEWRLRMMALIFYVKYKDELKDIVHPMRDEMDLVLKKESVKGWVPLWEMQERAEMYGVDLYP